MRRSRRLVAIGDPPLFAHDRRWDTYVLVTQSSMSERGQVVHARRDLKTIGGPPRVQLNGWWDTYVVVAPLEKLIDFLDLCHLIVWRPYSRCDVEHPGAHRKETSSTPL
jgi:hypothetical protein